SLVKLYRIDPGVRKDGVLMFGVRSAAQYPQARSWVVQGALLDRLRALPGVTSARDRKSTRLNSSHGSISYAVFCLKKKSPPCTRSPLLRSLPPASDHHHLDRTTAGRGPTGGRRRSGPRPS